MCFFVVLFLCFFCLTLGIDQLTYPLNSMLLILLTTLTGQASQESMNQCKEFQGKGDRTSPQKSASWGASTLSFKIQSVVNLSSQIHCLLSVLFVFSTEPKNKQLLRNQKHVPCFYQGLEIGVKVWKSAKCCGNTS